MAFPDSLTPVLDGAGIHPWYVQADDSHTQTNNIPPIYQSVVVSAVTNDTSDFVVLPPIADVPIGHTITLLCNANSNFDVRTPAASNTKINDVDADGTNGYLCTDTEVHKFIKISSTAWVAFALDKLGAVVTAIVPGVSASASLSPSASASASRSPSASLSPSASASASRSPSASASASRSPSASLSPSASESSSASASRSPSVSASASRSPSASLSPSASRSPSASLSPSASVSPSP